MTTFPANFLIAGLIIINDFRVSTRLAFRVGPLTDLILYAASFMGFPTPRPQLSAVYLQTVNIDGSTTVSLLAAKLKVAPLKTISVP